MINLSRRAITVQWLLLIHERTFKRWGQLSTIEASTGTPLRGLPMLLASPQRPELSLDCFNV